MDSSLSTEESPPDLVPGAPVQVVTNDGHIFRAEVVEVRVRDGREDLAVLKFDTGWVTSYPVSMVKRLAKP
jgi:hypothetical protein